MDEKQTARRPDQAARDTTVMRERPRTPGNQPAGARPRRGTASEQAQARRERMRSAGQSEAGASEFRDPPIRKVEQDPRETQAPVKKKKKKKKKTHRVYNTNFGFKFLTMLAVVAAITLSMVIFFKVKHVEVVFLGAEGYDLSTPQTTAASEHPEGEKQTRGYYTAEEIVAASAINIDENLISLSKANVASRIHAALPYINEIQVKKVLPGTVIISVSEFKVTYGVQDETGGWWLLSREGRVLEPTDEHDVKGHLILTGMPIQVPQAGDYIKLTAGEGVDMSEIAAKRSAALSILPQLEKTSYAKKIVSVDLSSSYNIVLWYGTQYEIRIGNTENLAYKLQYLEGVLEELGKDKSGTIDLTFNEDQAAHFLPFG